MQTYPLDDGARIFVGMSTNLAPTGADALARRAGRILRRVRGFGLARQCPMCNALLARFEPEGESHAVLFELDVVGGGRRDGVICPVCRAVDRERLVHLFLKQRALLADPDLRMVHVAPEQVLGAQLRARLGSRYMSADLMTDFVDVNFDLTDIPYPDASFGAVICNHVMEHIPDDGKAMREVLRVLKPGGWAILQVPIGLKLEMTIEDPSVTDVPERERRFGQFDHIRIYSAGDYIARLTRAGFSVEPFRWTDASETYGGAANRFGLLEKEVLFFARKAAA